MKTVALSAAVAAVAAWIVVTLTAPEPAAPSYDPVALDLEDRLASLEGRIARLTRELDAPTLATAGTPTSADPALAKRIAELEKALKALRSEATQNPDDAPGRDAPAPPQVAKATTHDVDAARERIRRSKVSDRERALQYKALADHAGKLGRFALQEDILRELIETAGEDDAVAQEALYTIGWARRNKGDHAAAREAWLHADRELPADHGRRGYARFYAAEMGAKTGDAGMAERELHDLIRDIEADPRRIDPHGTLIKRSRALLATLDG